MEEKKILYVFPYGDIYHPKRGGEARVHGLIKELVKNFKVITLEAEEHKKDAASINISKRYFTKKYYIHGIGNIGKTFADINPTYIHSLVYALSRENPNIVQISFPPGFLPFLFLKKRFNVVLIYDSHDVELDKVRNILFKEKSVPILKKIVAFVTTYFAETFACKLSDIIITVSHESKKRLHELYMVPLEKIIVIESGCNISNNSNNESIKKTESIVFHGTYSYPPNKEAVRLIEEYISRKIRYKKKWRFILLGKGVPVKNITNTNIKYIGFVDDLYPFLKSCSIAIVPLLKGTGTRLKILDYMVAGLPIVTTKKGAEGIELINGKHALIVDDVNEDFIKMIEYLIENPKIRKKLGHNARKLAEKKYSWEKIGERLIKVYKLLLSDLNS